MLRVFTSRLGRLVTSRHVVAVLWLALLPIWLPDGPPRWILPIATALGYVAHELTRRQTEKISTSQRRMRQTADLNLGTLEALARAIEAKDRASSSHLTRMQLYASRLAEAVGLSREDVEATRMAALLHDVGKLAVPASILSKPGPLTREEFEKIKVHSQVGAELIAAVPFPYPVAQLVLGHHERWDGGGYPNGLAGEDIPIGARILTVVDFYDSVTADRPYHAALSHESAVNLMRYESGRALDPLLVTALLELLPSLEAEMTVASLRDVASSGSPTSTGGGSSAFETIALAHREIYALYEIAQSMGTSLSLSETMELISSKLSSVIPWSGCALYVTEHDRDTLRCRFAAGVGAPKLLHSSIGPGEGPAGLAINDHRTLVNTSPDLAFEAVGIPAEDQLRSSLICPLVLRKSLIGCLVLFHREPDAYTEDHRRLIEQIADQAGAVIHNAVVFEQAHRDSLTDALTSLPNRRSMLDYLEHEIARADRARNEVAIMVLDIDRFKPINDNHGHHFGDRALREVAGALTAGLRPYDLCARYGGDEFIIVLADCSRAGAEEKRLEFEERLDQITIEVPGGRLSAIKASVGISVYPHDGANPDELLAVADRQMYEEKGARRQTASIRSKTQAGTRPVLGSFEKRPPTGDAEGAALLV